MARSAKPRRAPRIVAVKLPGPVGPITAYKVPRDDPVHRLARFPGPLYRVPARSMVSPQLDPQPFGRLDHWTIIRILKGPKP